MHSSRRLTTFFFLNHMSYDWDVIEKIYHPCRLPVALFPFFFLKHPHTLTTQDNNADIQSVWSNCIWKIDFWKYKCLFAWLNPGHDKCISKRLNLVEIWIVIWKQEIMLLPLPPTIVRQINRRLVHGKSNDVCKILITLNVSSIEIG